MQVQGQIKLTAQTQNILLKISESLNVCVKRTWAKLSDLAHPNYQTTDEGTPAVDTRHQYTL